MQNPFYPFPAVNLIANYITHDGRWQHQAFQVFGKPLVAAYAVCDLLISQGCTPSCIGQVMGEYTIDQLRELADSNLSKDLNIRCLYFAPSVDMIPDEGSADRVL